MNQVGDSPAVLGEFSCYENIVSVSRGKADEEEARELDTVAGVATGGASAVNDDKDEERKMPDSPKGQIDRRITFSHDYLEAYLGKETFVDGKLGYAI